MREHRLTVQQVMLCSGRVLDTISIPHTPAHRAPLQFTTDWSQEALTCCPRIVRTQVHFHSNWIRPLPSNDILRCPGVACSHNPTFSLPNTPCPKHIGQRSWKSGFGVLGNGTTSVGSGTWVGYERVALLEKKLLITCEPRNPVIPSNTSLQYTPTGRKR